MWFEGMEDLVERERKEEMTVQEVETKPQYIYAIRDNKTRKLVNRKGNSSNSFFTRKYFAEAKCNTKHETVVTYLLKEIIN